MPAKSSRNSEKGCIGFVHGGVLKLNTIRVFSCDDPEPTEVAKELSNYYGESVDISFVQTKNVSESFEKMLESIDSSTRVDQTHIFKLSITEAKKVLREATESKGCKSFSLKNESKKKEDENQSDNEDEKDEKPKKKSKAKKDESCDEKEDDDDEKEEKTKKKSKSKKDESDAEKDEEEEKPKKKNSKKKQESDNEQSDEESDNEGAKLKKKDTKDTKEKETKSAKSKSKSK
jgi:hypothetical protein